MTPPFPEIKAGALYVDPPWRFATFSEKGRGRSPDGLTPKSERNLQRQNRPERHYPTMTLEDIKALPVGDLAAKDCVLFLWAVDPLLPEAIEVGRAWGFKYKTVAFIWAKERKTTSRRGDDKIEPNHARFPLGTGYWTRANPEICLLFTRGKPKRLHADVRKLVIAPRREHSRKPDEIRPMIERLVDGPHMELFARSSRDNWTSWGLDAGLLDADAAPGPWLTADMDLGPLMDGFYPSVVHDE